MIVTGLKRNEFDENPNLYKLVTTRKIIVKVAVDSCVDEDGFILEVLQDWMVIIKHLDAPTRQVYMSTSTDNIFRYFRDDRSHIFTVRFVVETPKRLNIKIYVNVKLLRNLLEQGNIVPNRNGFFRDLSTSHVLDVSQNVLTDADIEKKFSVPVNTEGLYDRNEYNNLYNFQKRKVHWIRSVEEAIENGTTTIEDLESQLRFMKLDEDLYVDFEQYSFVKRDFVISNMANAMRLTGGCLFDYSGLGKIRTIVTRCIADDVQDKPTLVVCPVETCRYWQKEIISYKPTSRVAVICNKKDYRRYATEGFEKYNFVIVSVCFVRGTTYNKSIYAWKDNYTFDDNILGQAYEAILSEHKAFANQNCRQLAFHRVSWRRVIVDECTSILSCGTVVVFIKHLDVQFKWMVSGSYISSGYQLQTILRLLDSKKHQDGVILTSNLITQFISKAVSRDTYDSICNEVKEPQTIYSVELLNMTDEEVFNYYNYNNNCSEEELVDRCTFPLTVEPTSRLKSFGQLEEAKKYNMDCLLNDEHNWKTEIRYLREDADVDESHVMHLQSKITQAQNIRKYLKSNLPIEKCSICLDDMDGITTGLTRCGHLFCFLCLLQWSSESNTCPECRDFVTFYSIAKVHSIADAPTDPRIFLFGTKMTRCIDYINQIKGEKVILFVKEYKGVKKLQEIFDRKDVGIRYTRCVGTAPQRFAAIDKFNDPKSNCNILLLSGTYMCEGARFPHCSKAIILEHSYPSIHKRDKEVETIVSKIKRMNDVKAITVKRFIAIETIEYSNYLEMAKEEVAS